MRLIDADALIDRLARMWESRQITNTKYKCFTEMLIAEPTADVQVAVQVQCKLGKWIYDKEASLYGNPYGHYECDRCGECVPHMTNYCPNCGAVMRKETEDEIEA